jgi:hypothetical protein
MKAHRAGITETGTCAAIPAWLSGNQVRIRRGYFTLNAVRCRPVVTGVVVVVSQGVEEVMLWIWKTGQA